MSNPESIDLSIAAPPADSSNPVPPPPVEPPKRHIVIRLLRGFCIGLFFFALICMAGWMVLAVYYSALNDGRPPRSLMAAIVAIASIVLIALIFFVRPRRWGMNCGRCWGIGGFLALFGIVLGWFFSLQPSNTRQWPVEYSRTPTAVLDGNLLTVRNIRNFNFTGETEAEPAWYDHTYDLSKLKSVDYILSYWGPTAIAHGMVSFEFEGDRPLAVSVETRREKTESYSAVEGFFRQYELIYIFADERDVIRVRTNHRNENVYVYRTGIPPAGARAILMDYVKRANDLAEKPDFYNAMTSSCSTNILQHLRAYRPTARFSISILLNGRSARAAYENGGLDHGSGDRKLSWDELQEMSHVNARAKAADQDPEFSARIRDGMRPAPIMTSIREPGAAPETESMQAPLKELEKVPPKAPLKTAEPANP